MIVKTIENYDGELLHHRFAYNFFREKTLPIGNIIAFRSPMLVEADGMIDSEDIIKNEFIYSDDAMNFLWEIPCLSDPFGAVAYQRLFNTNIANILSSKYLDGAPIEVDGDDLIVHKDHEQGGVKQSKGKCSVSITYVRDGVTLGHTGINVHAGEKAPSHAYSTGLNNMQVSAFMRDTIDMFYQMNDDMFLATTKTIVK
jgi:hypothetical protein